MDLYDVDKFADQYRISSARLSNWDYSNPGYYFITTCTHLHNHFFGEIINNKIDLSKMGRIAHNFLINIPNHFKNVKINAFVIMPNHVHVIIQLLSNSVETRQGASLSNTNASLSFPPRISTTGKQYTNYHFHQLATKSNQKIPLIISQYKSAVTREINKLNCFFSWQTRFYDRIIRNEKQLLAIKKYIKNNPNNWDKDPYNI